MKTILVLAAVVAIATLLFAQASSSWSGTEAQQLLSACITHNSDSVLCAATDGVAFSYQGAAFVKVSGATPTISIGSVTTLAAGANATVTKDATSTATNIVLDFGIPQGMTGATGITGATGATGVQGPAGPVQSFGTAKCPAWTGGSSGLTIGPGCVESTP